MGRFHLQVEQQMDGANHTVRPFCLYGV